MNEDFLITQIYRRTAQISVTASSLRNQGAGGLIKISRHYFENAIDLKEFGQVLKKKEYIDYLNSCTNGLLKKFPRDGKSWGGARKGLNLFFREIIYNKYLADYLEIPSDYEENLKAIRRLEVPLDRDVATGLIDKFPELPKWKSIKVLNKEESDLFQDIALKYAKSQSVARIHLDLEFWRRDK